MFWRACSDCRGNTSPLTYGYPLLLWGYYLLIGGTTTPKRAKLARHKLRFARLALTFYKKLPLTHGYHLTLTYCLPLTHGYPPRKAKARRRASWRSGKNFPRRYATLCRRPKPCPPYLSPVEQLNLHYTLRERARGGRPRKNGKGG